MSTNEMEICQKWDFFFLIFFNYYYYFLLLNLRCVPALLVVDRTYSEAWKETL